LPEYVGAKALESAHAVWEAVRQAKMLPQDKDVVLVRYDSLLAKQKLNFTHLASQCLSGRGDKDVEQISQLLPGKWADILDWHVSSS
jgi:tryptophan synthase